MRIKLENLLIGFTPNKEPVFATDKDGFKIALRDVRDIFLRESDWIQNSDSQIPQETKQEWLNYRQQLRDFPSSFGDSFIDSVVEFPEPPLAYRPRTWVNLVFQESEIS
jgi:hypothetical protein